MPGVDNHGQVTPGLDARDVPAAAYMPPGASHGSGDARQFPIPVHVPPAGHHNHPLPPIQSPDEFAVDHTLPLIGMVHSQDTVNVMT